MKPECAMKWRKAKALLLGTQVAVVGGSVLTGFFAGIFFLFNTALVLDSLSAAVGFLFGSFLLSLVIVNTAVIFLVLPLYLVYPKTLSRSCAALWGAVAGGVVIFYIANLAGIGAYSPDPDVPRFFFIAGVPGFYMLAGVVYGCLTGIFASELEHRLILDSKPGDCIVGCAEK